MKKKINTIPKVHEAIAGKKNARKKSIFISLGGTARRYRMCVCVCVRADRNPEEALQESEAKQKIVAKKRRLAKEIERGPPRSQWRRRPPQAKSVLQVFGRNAPKTDAKKKIREVHHPFRRNRWALRGGHPYVT